jgi:CRISPR-associated protein Cas2
MENYFFSREETARSDRHLVLVIYDIPLNKRRTRFVKLMESYGVRVQKSAFEMIITDVQYNELIHRIPGYIGEEDNVRVYKLRSDTLIESWGSGMTPAEDVIII